MTPPTRMLAGLLPPDSWLDRQLRGAPVKWCPLVEFGEPRRALGLIADGTWTWGMLDQIAGEVFEVETPSAVGLLPVMEVPLPMVRFEATVSARRLGISGTAIVENLPIAAIISAALATRSDYWVSLVVCWLGEQPPSEQLLAAVESAAIDRRVSQSNRHALRKWRRSASGRK
jgi:hypothetical protein